MKTYTQRPTSISEQSALLSARGVSGDCGMLARMLECVGYYRLRGFLFPFMKENGRYDTWITVRRLWQIYTLDRRVRMAVFDCIGRLEVAFRTRFSNEHALMSNDAFCYMHEDMMDLSSKRRMTEFSRFRDRIKQARETSASRPCIQRFFKNYGSDNLPVWITMEIVDFGLLLHYFNLLPKQLRISIANSYGVTDKTFLTWLTILNMTRNACAHHESLIFKRFPTQTIKRYCRPADNPLLRDLSDALEPTNESEGIGLYSVLCLLQHLLRAVRPESRWQKRLSAIWDTPDFSDIIETVERYSGFPRTSWRSCRLWTQAGSAETSYTDHSMSLQAPVSRRLQEVRDAYTDASTPGWDGYDALPVTEQTYLCALRFVRQLPLGLDMPEVCAEPDGALCFDWYKDAGNQLSCSVDRANAVSFAARLKGDAYFGTFLLNDVFPDVFNLLLGRIGK